MKPAPRAETGGMCLVHHANNIDRHRSRLPPNAHESGREHPQQVAPEVASGQHAEGADEASVELALAVLEIAREVEIETDAKWHADGKAHRAFRRALLTAISKWRPADYDDNLFNEVELGPLEKRPHASHPVANADELGIAIAHHVLGIPDRKTRDKVREARKETLKEMLKLHQNREGEGND
jgi:hypothetical protein